ncbi:MAG: hypothetical protein A3I83_05210 [Methylotenera sp. RIFCSPLOWO2_02_FULL_45_14]|nr:MAG: hypothetical protein A3I83_05210 [Methylotenera sp. RIFCSPLOWO2_02_FULL_45_14]
MPYFLTKTIKKITSLTGTNLQWLFVISAALLAWRIAYIQQGWVNDDSVLYFEVARLFSIGEWKQGFALYNWPLYPAIISLLHKTTGGDFQFIAQILNVLFFTLATYSFTQIIRLAGGNKLTMFCGVLLLFSTPYIVGNVLGMLLRDEGFWAFFLLSIQYFIQFYRSEKINDALLWQLSAVIAVLFRVEAITFLALLPLILLTKKDAPHIKSWAYANSIGLLTVTFIAFTLILNPTLTLKNYGRLNDIFTVLASSYTNITQTLVAKAQIMNEQILGGFLDNYGMTGIVVTLLTILIVKCVSAPGWMASLILIGNWKNSVKQISPDALKIFYWVMALATLNAAVILTSTFILSGRYIVSLGLIMLVLASFCLASLFDMPKTRWRKLLPVLILTILSLSLINNTLAKNNEYNYEQHAVNWIKAHNQSNAPVFYVSSSARYYAGEPYAGRGYDEWDYTINAISDGSIQKYQYLAINIRNHQPEKEQQLFNALTNYQRVKEVMGFRSKKKVMIFVKKQNS